MNDNKTALNNLVVMYGFFFTMMAFLITGLKELKEFFGLIELYVVYVSMWFLGLCSYIIGMNVKMIIMDEEDDHWVNRALWLLVIIVAIGFVVVLGETLMGNAVILMEYTVSDAGQALLAFTIATSELKKWVESRRIK